MRRQSLPKTCRMTERAEFVRLFDQPHVFKTKLFQAFYKENGKKTSRIGITLKGKTTSVWRNKIKRTIREWFRISRFARDEKLAPVDMNLVIHIPKEMNDEYILKFKDSLGAWKFS